MSSNVILVSFSTSLSVCVYLRLLQMLELGKLSECKDPILTYGRLEAEASSLQKELVSVQDSLERTAQEQGYSGARLEHDRDALERSAYSDIVQPLLRPQVCATATPAQELCPNAQVRFSTHLSVSHPHRRSSF